MNGVLSMKVLNMKTLIKRLSKTTSAEEREIELTVVKESGFRLILEEVSVRESDIRAVVIYAGECLFPSPIYPDDPFSGVGLNGCVLLEGKQRLLVVSPMFEFIVRGWRPLEWWYYAQFDNRVAGGQGDDYVVDIESVNNELKEYKYAKKYIISQEKNPRIIEYSQRESNDSPDSSTELE